MIYFLDTSALVKRYLDEPGSARVRQLMRRARVQIAVARITEAEAYAAIARATRANILTVEQREAAFDDVAEDVCAAQIVEIRKPITLAVRELVTRWPLRGYDAIQLASALRLHSDGLPVDLWCADATLADAARGEGLRVTLV